MPRTGARFWQVLFVVVAMVSTAALLVERKFNAQRPFDKETWNRQEENDSAPTIFNLWRDSNVRLKMFEDLKRRLVGVSKKEVEQLLGPPDPNIDLLHHPTDYYYLVGTLDRVLDKDGLWLCVKFQNDHVVQIQLIQD